MKDVCIDRAVAICKKVVSSFCFSWKRRRDLATAKQELNVPYHQLISESPTRWGSRARMIERVLEQEQAILQVLAADKKTRHIVLTWQDLKVLESVHTSLKPCYLVKAMSQCPLSNLCSIWYLQWQPAGHGRFSGFQVQDNILHKRRKGRAITEMEEMLSESKQGTDEMAASQSTEPLKKKTLESFFKMAAATSSATPHQRESTWRKILPTCSYTVLTVKQVPCNGGAIIKKCSQTWKL